MIKGLSLVIAEKKTGFALWRLNSITYLNDLKWTKPGHLTLKVYCYNLPFAVSTANQTTKKSRKNSKKVESLTNSSIYSSNFDKSLTYRPSVSFNDMKFLNNDFYNEFSDLSSLLSPADPNNPYVFAAIKFDSDFECSRFYDFYRLLFNNSKNDDLFNPNFKQSAITKKTNLFQIFYKKIAKNSISSPCAFHHINSLTLTEDDSRHKLESISDNQSIASSDDSTTIASNIDSSIIFNDSNKKL